MTTEFPAPVRRVQAALTAAGLEVHVLEFPASTRTAVEAAAAVGTTVGQIVKSLLFLAAGRPVLALVSGSNRLDLDRLGTLAGRPVTKADADAVREATGYSIGGVPPIGFPQPIPCFVDRDLLAYPTVWAAAGTPHHVFSITPANLVRVAGGAVADLTV
jgi:prolyl-tRNA editing enzyme YbaK/EbsC (Cys-tRNA(Pro) deacylase)